MFADFFENRYTGDELLEGDPLKRYYTFSQLQEEVKTSKLELKQTLDKIGALELNGIVLQTVSEKCSSNLLYSQDSYELLIEIV